MVPSAGRGAPRPSANECPRGVDRDQSSMVRPVSSSSLAPVLRTEVIRRRPSDSWTTVYPSPGTAPPTHRWLCLPTCRGTCGRAGGRSARERSAGAGSGGLNASLAGSRPHTASRTNGADDFDGWVVGPVLNLVSPLFCEARYLLAEEPDMRDPALYRPCKEGQTIDQCWREEFVFVSCVTGDLFDDEAVVRSSPPFAEATV